MVPSRASVNVDGSGGSRKIVEARATSCQQGGLDFGPMKGVFIALA